MKLKPLLLCHLLIALLISSFFWPATRTYWDALDLAFFHFFNDPLRDSKFLQIFWAFANHKWADWIEDLFILVFFVACVKSTPQIFKKRKIAELAFCVLYIALIIFFVNRLFFREYIEIFRDSPSLVVDGSVRLSNELTWLSIKDKSPKCFPADHATTAILFAASFSYFASRRLGILACLYAFFLCLPRIVVGAHWLSDALVGSGTIVLFLLSWALCTPLHKWIIDGFEKCFSLFRARDIV